MNVEQINFQDVLAYFACFYWWIIPTSILAAVAAAVAVDWVRIGVLGYTDDWEKGEEQKVWPWVDKLLSPSSHGVTAEDLAMFIPLGKVEKVGDFWLVGTDAYWWNLKCPTEGVALQHAKKLSGMLRRSDRDAYVRKFRLNDTILPTEIKLVFICGALLVVLMLHKEFPVLTYIVVAIAVALNLSRGVIRLKKKFMAHIKDPNAHKGE